MKRLLFFVAVFACLFLAFVAVGIYALGQLPEKTPVATAPAETATKTATKNTPLPQPTATKNIFVAVVKTTALHIRSGPGIAYPVTGWLHAGDSVTVLGCRHGWAKLAGGWVNAAYLSDNCEDIHENQKR